MSQCRRKTIYRMVTKLCRNDVQSVRCRICVVISVSVMTWASVDGKLFTVWLPNFVGMVFRLWAAGFVLLALGSWLAIGRWYWYGDVELKHKHQCALQLQTINMSLDKVSRALLVKLFYQNNNSAAVLHEYRHIKGIWRGSLSILGLKNMIWRFKLTVDLGIASGRGRLQLHRKLLKLLSPWLRMLDAMCDLQAVNELCHKHSMIHRSKSAANNCEMVSVCTSLLKTFATWCRHLYILCSYFLQE